MYAEATKIGVKVVCRECKGRIQPFWEGSLIKWAHALGKKKEPEWYKRARKHSRAENHHIDVQYPSGRVVGL